MQPKIFTAENISCLVDVKDLINPLETAMIAVSNGAASHPPRFAAPINEAGRLGLMYGGLSTPPIHGAKVLSLFPGAPDMGLSSHQGYVLLFDSKDGRPLAVLDADRITAMRTAAMSMLATRCLARLDPKTITICGAGEQAEWHLRASLSCFENAKICLWSRNPASAGALRERFPHEGSRIDVKEDLAKAISGADVIHTTTAAKEPFLHGTMLQAGQHINLVGASLADSREIDDEGVAKARIFTDSLESSSRESGEILGAKQAGLLPPEYTPKEIGTVLSGQEIGRHFAGEITAYKSHGLIVQDLAAAYEVFLKDQ